MTSPIENLPEELLVQIFGYLDHGPPSLLNLREEPSLKLVASDLKPLKHTSLVSVRWRRLTLPLLFKYARLQLDAPPRPQWSECEVCRDGHLDRPEEGWIESGPYANGIHAYHDEIMTEAFSQLSNEPTLQSSHVDPMAEVQGELTRHILLHWAPRFYHILKDFLNLLTCHELALKVESFVLYTGPMLSGKFDRFPHRAGADRDWRYRCAAAFWRHLLSVLDPRRVVILAPPTDLACLTNCAIDTFGDWAFGDMEYHVLDLRLDATSLSPSLLLGTTFQYSTLDHTPRRYPGIAGSSILHLRPWHHITIGEGAFLKAYGTYEYFERGPPSLIYSIKDCLTPRPTYSASVQRMTPSCLPSLRKLSYIAIFPFAEHLDFRELLPQLEELDLQLAPTLSVAGSAILNDPQRIGKAELQDCWSELVTVYHKLAAQLATFRITTKNVPYLKRLVCHDMGRATLRRELDEVFIGLCLPVWCELRTGQYVRLKGSAEIDDDGGDWSRFDAT
ncbi:hypothetical protein LTR97_009314 [Elasticomyces elasticus]|uniref:F-box domain-containing protein n=1 Tax=Elasticomyces elasticus TaxID=574655 RepID=A0AAN7W1V4_9PEZI|nr:hypothetical protein LTR97_009314 [Elasticomyces elasticus]